MTYIGAYTVGSTITYLFTSRNSANVPTALVSTASVDIYKDGGTTQATALGSLTTNLDSKAGLNMLVVPSADSAAFFTADSEFAVVLQGIASVSEASIANEVICSFSLNNGALLANSINSSSFSADAFAGSTQSIAIKPGAYSTVTVGAGNITPGTYSGVTLGVNNIGPGTYSGATVGINNIAPAEYSGVTVGAVNASASSSAAEIATVVWSVASGTYSGLTVRVEPILYSGMTVGVNNIGAGTFSGVTVGINNIGPGTYSGATVGINNIGAGAYSGVTVDMRPASLLSYNMGNSRLYQDAFHMTRNKVDASSSVVSFYLTDDTTSLFTASATTGSAGLVAMDPA